MAKELYQSLYQSKQNSRNYQHKFVRMPIYKLGEFFKIIFSYTLGFEWILHLPRLDLTSPNKEISLSTLHYDHEEKFSLLEKYIDTFPSSLLRKIAFDQEAATYLITDYSLLNLIFYFFIGLNYSAEILGKFFGWSLAFIFTLPIYLVIRTYYAITQTIIQHQANSRLIVFCDDDLIREWSACFKQSGSEFFYAKFLAKNIAKCLSFRELIKKLEKPNLNPSYRLWFEAMKEYIEERITFLKRTNDPHTVTELHFLNDIARITLKSDRYAFSMGESYFFQEGLKYERDDNYDVALYCYSLIEKESSLYQRAMMQSAHINIALMSKVEHKDTSAQRYYAEKAYQFSVLSRDPDLIQITKFLIKNRPILRELSSEIVSKRQVIKDKKRS